MNKITVTSLICGGLISLAGPSLIAQTSSPTSSGQSSSSGLGTPGSSSYGSRSSMQSGREVRLSNLMHATVQSKDGKQLGHIRDFTVDPQTGRIEFAVLSKSEGERGGTASSTTTTPTTTTHQGSPSYMASGKLIPVPWQLFSQNWSSTHLGGSSSTAGSAMGAPALVLNVDESKLESAPSFDANNWNELQQGSLDQKVYSHFGVSKMSDTGTPGSSISGQGTSGSQGGSSEHQGSSPQEGSSSIPEK